MFDLSMFPIGTPGTRAEHRHTTGTPGTPAKTASVLAGVPSKNNSLRCKPQHSITSGTPGTPTKNAGVPPNRAGVPSKNNNLGMVEHLEHVEHQKNSNTGNAVTIPKIWDVVIMSGNQLAPMVIIDPAHESIESFRHCLADRFGADRVVSVSPRE